MRIAARRRENCKLSRPPRRQAVLSGLGTVLSRVRTFASDLANSAHALAKGGLRLDKKKPPPWQTLPALLPKADSDLTRRDSDLATCARALAKVQPPTCEPCSRACEAISPAPPEPRRFRASWAPHRCPASSSLTHGIREHRRRDTSRMEADHALVFRAHILLASR